MAARRVVIVQAGLSAMTLLVGLWATGGDLGDLVQKFSFLHVDAPSMPPGQTAIPILGNHYFGDWQFYVGWMRTPNPYLEPAAAIQMLPPAYLLLRPLAQLSLGWSLTLVMSASVLSTLAAAKLLLSGESRLRLFLVWISVCLGSAGIITSVDRGNLQALAMGLGCTGLLLQARGRTGWGAVTLGLAICLKPYLLFLLLWPLYRRRLIDIVLPVSLVSVCSLFGFLVLPGSTGANLHGFVDSLLGYGDPSASAAIFLRTFGMVGLLIHPGAIFGDPSVSALLVASSTSWALAIPGLAWLMLVLYVLFFRATAPSIKFTLMLSLSQFALPSSQVYTMAWASIAVMALAFDPEMRLVDHRVRRLVLASVIVSNVPMPIDFATGDTAAPLAALVTPCVWLFCGLVVALFGDRVHSSTAPPTIRREGSLVPAQ